MAKLYVFGIGGTGSRVIKSLAFLLAAGVEIQNDIDTIVPIIIDPDTANGDLNRTADILTKYQEIKKPFENTDAGFFNIKLKTLSQLVDGTAINVADNFKFQVNGTSNKKFKEYIDYSGLGQVNKDFVDLLFSEHNLDASMDVGFKGNPNIGSVVLNQFTESEEFEQFLTSFGKNDKIFIISSIFGGTGAAGFPLLLKNLREATISGAGGSDVNDAVIGAISYLPYFKLQSSDGSEINSTTFLGKTKAALSYYEKSIVEGKRLNSFYYLGDHDGGMYDNYDGKAQQKNHAHFLEVAGALSIIDFLADSVNLQTQNAKALNPVYKEYGIESAIGAISFKSLGGKSYDQLTKSLSQFTLFSKFLDLGLQISIDTDRPWVDPKAKGIDKEFFNDYYFENNFQGFMNYFKDWLKELEENTPSFRPYKSNISFDNGIDIVEGFEVKKKAFGLMKDESMNQMVAKANKDIAQYSALKNEAKFVKLFYSVTEDVLTTKVL